MSSEKKHRSPFASFKRADSAREMQIPESAPEETARPDTSVTTQDSINEPVRVTSESLDHGGPEAISTGPEPLPAGATTNGTALQATQSEPGTMNIHATEVCGNKR